MKVRAGKLGVVVEHLLEMGHEPAGVGGVPVEAPAQLIADPAVGHLVERELDRRGGPFVAGRHPPEQVLECHRLGELRRAAPRTVAGIELGIEGPVDGFEEVAVDGDLAARCDARLLDERRDQPLPGGQHVTALGRPRLRHALEDLPERRHPVPRLVGVVGPAVERLSVRCQEHRHRPATAAGHRLDRRHVDRVEIRALLPVHLDRDELIVQQPGGRLVLERLALHDVAPMTRRIADRQEDGAIEQLGPGQRVAAPGHPIDRIVRMLEEIRAGLAREPIGHRSMVVGGGRRPARRILALECGAAPHRIKD